MGMSLGRWMVLGLVLFLGGVGSCIEDADEAESIAEVVIPLTAVGKDGSLYRLEADFFICGIWYSTVLSEWGSRMTAQVQPGETTEVRLMDNWTLYRKSGALWEPTEAVLLSPNPVLVTLVGGESVVVRYVFGIGNETLELLATSDMPSVGVEIGVDEVVGGIGLCPEDRYCVAGNAVFSITTMSAQDQARWVPFAISFDYIEESTPYSFSTGTVTLHFDLTNTPGLSPEQFALLDRLKGDYDRQPTCVNWLPGEWEFSASRVMDGNDQNLNVRAIFPAVSDQWGRQMLVTASGSLMDSWFWSGPVDFMTYGALDRIPKTAFFVEP